MILRVFQMCFQYSTILLISTLVNMSSTLILSIASVPVVSSVQNIGYFLRTVYIITPKYLVLISSASIFDPIYWVGTGYVTSKYWWYWVTLISSVQILSTSSVLRYFLPKILSIHQYQQYHQLQILGVLPPVITPKNTGYFQYQHYCQLEIPSIIQ